MLSAVNSMRLAAGWPAITWADILSGDPSPAAGVVISARHIVTCRARMTEALLALGAAPRGYTDTDPFLKTIKAVHINEIQEQTQ